MNFLKSLALFSIVLGVVTTSAHAQNNNDNRRYFSASGTAEIRVKPDRVTVTLGINNRSKDLSVAKDEMNATIRQAIAYSRSKGVQEKNIQTAFINIQPQYRYNDNEEIMLTYYELNQTLTITLEDISQYDALIYGLLDLDINTVQDIQFSSSEVRRYRDEARVKAVQAAKEKAVLLTNAAGIRLGNIVDVSEDGYMYAGGGNARMMNSSQNAFAADSVGGGAEGTGAAAGMISISATVRLTYELAN